MKYANKKYVINILHSFVMISDRPIAVVHGAGVPRGAHAAGGRERWSAGRPLEKLSTRKDVRSADGNAACCRWGGRHLRWVRRTHCFAI